MFNDETAHAQSLMQQVQQANQATAAAQGDTRAALERGEAAKAEARETNMSSMRITDELQRARQECKDLLVDNVRYTSVPSIACCLLSRQICCPIQLVLWVCEAASNL